MKPSALRSRLFSQQLRDACLNLGRAFNTLALARASTPHDAPSAVGMHQNAILSILAVSEELEREQPAFDNALVAGDWVETSQGRHGEVVMTAADGEGSPGYLVRVDRSGDLVWVYHLAVESGVSQCRRQEGKVA